MRKALAGKAMVIDDEPAIRGLLAAILADHGCAIVTGENAADLERGIRDFAPDILFLDVGLRDTDAFALLDILAASSFTGAIQIVSGRAPYVLERVFHTGGELGLRMRKPLAKPFRIDAIEQVLRDEALLRANDDTDAAEPGLVCRSWTCATAPIGLVDLAFASATGDRPAETPQSPAEQLSWWTTREGRYREPLLALPAPAALCIEARVADIPAMMPGLRQTSHSASQPAATIVLGEDDVFADLATTRDMLCVLRLCGATIRLTGCGTRFFAVTGHDPLPVDQAVLGNPLSAADRVMGRLAELAHRAGTFLLADDLGSGLGSAPVLPNSLDLWRDTSLPWQAFAPAGMMPARLPARLGQVGAWQRVALTDALSIRRTTDRSAQS